MNKTVLVDAYLGFGNFGDEYLVLATISKIKHSKRIYIKCCKCYTSIFFDNRLRKFNQNTVLFKWCNPIVPPLPYILLVDEIITVGGKYLGNIFEAIYLALLTLLAIKFGIPSVSIVYEQKIKELEYLCNHVLHCKSIEFYDPAKLKHNDLNEVFSRACERLEGK